MMGRFLAGVKRFTGFSSAAVIWTEASAFDRFSRAVAGFCAAFRMIRSVVAQGDHGVDCGGATGGSPGGEKSKDAEEQWNQ